MHLVKMTMKWPSSMIGRGPKMFRFKIHWKLTESLLEKLTDWLKDMLVGGIMEYEAEE